MIKIAICGGIGSGKSVVTSLLRELGAKVIVADEINAALLKEKEYQIKIGELFPEVVHNNVVDKKLLASIVYQNEDDRERLMRIAHPIIFDRMRSQSEGYDLVFFEIPLMARCPIRFDSIWYLSTDTDLRVQKIMARDNVTEERARRIIDLQLEELELMDKADVIIKHNYCYEELKEKVKGVYCSILRRFS